MPASFFQNLALDSLCQIERPMMPALTRISAITLVFLILANFCLGQSVPRFKKYDIGETGAQCYFPAEPNFELSYSEDNSEVYAADVEVEGVTYSAVVVRLAEPMGGDEPEVWEELLISYMDFLCYEIYKVTGLMEPGKGHTLDSNPMARGVINFGETEEGIQLSIKGWVDYRMLAVLVVSSDQDINYNLQELFLNGFRFPEE